MRFNRLAQACQNIGLETVQTSKERKTTMTINFTFDPLHYIGIVFLAYLASLAGNLIASIIVGIFTPSLDGQKLYTVAGLWMMAVGMTIPKIIIALIGAGIALANTDTAGAATVWAMGISGSIGLAFSLLLGLGRRN